MAMLPNDTGVLRLRLDLVERERARDAGAGEGVGEGATRVLASVSLESLDRRDGEWWPIVRLPVLYLAPGGVEALSGGLADLLQGAAPGFAWRSADDGVLGLQIGESGSPSGLLVAEVGLDLGLFLAESSGSAWRPASELALFRWPVTRADAVSFADALRRESDALAPAA